MPDQIQPNFEHALEADMQRLAVEVKKHRENPEQQSSTDRELLKKSIQEFTPAASTTPTPAPQSVSPLPVYAKDASPETKLEIEYLLDMAFKQGVGAANAAAQNTNPFVLDAFHDALTGALYPELQKRGLIK